MQRWVEAKLAGRRRLFHERLSCNRTNDWLGGAGVHDGNCIRDLEALSRRRLLDQYRLVERLNLRLLAWLFSI